VELGLVGGPELLQGEDALAEEAAAVGGVGAVVGHLLLVPAGADAEEAAAGGQIEGGGLLGEEDRVVLGDEEDAGAEPEPAGDGGDHGEGDQGIEEPGEAVVDGGAARVDGGAGARPAGVLGEEEGLEAVLLQQVAGGADVGRVGGRGVVDADVHRRYRSTVARWLRGSP